MQLKRITIAEDRVSAAPLTASLDMPGDAVTVAIERGLAISTLHGRPLYDAEMSFSEFRKRQLSRGIYVEPRAAKPRKKPNAASS